MSAPQLNFRTIDLRLHKDTAVAFRRDSYICSFGSDTAMGNVDQYLTWLAERIANHPKGHVHLWRDDSIVGQIEMLIRPGFPPHGYVNLLYLVPALRGCGLGDALHRYVVDFMSARGAPFIRLSVSPDNLRAMAYYRKHSWQDRGPRMTNHSVHVMELHRT